MIVHFTRKGRGVASLAMDAVPRAGEAVMIGEADPPSLLMVWNVAWQVARGAEPPRAYVELRTELEYNRALYGRDDPAKAARPGNAEQR